MCIRDRLSLNPVSDTLCLGDTVQITWSGGNPADNIQILTINNTLWQTGFSIATVPNTGSYTWVVSGFPAGPGDLYQFYIQDVPNQNSWDYGSVFAICPIYGCIDPLALNFDQSATVDDGSCIYCNYGCTDSTAINYDSLATCDDGSCLTYIYGCTDPGAINYFSGANTDDGSCIYTVCTDSTAINYNSMASIDDGSCYYGGCQTPAPINLYVDNITDDRATINWDNMNINTCKVLKYVIRYRELGTNTWISKSGGAGNGSCVFGLNNTSKILMNLSPGTTYQYKIKAFYCFEGPSVWTLP